MERGSDDSDSGRFFVVEGVDGCGKTTQAALLARTVARTFRLPLLKRALRRRRATDQQANLSAARRWENVRGAFCIGARPREGLAILLVDDVMTTGATAGECARILKEAGAGRVNVFTLVRTLP